MACARESQLGVGFLFFLSCLLASLCIYLSLSVGGCLDQHLLSSLARLLACPPGLAPPPHSLVSHPLSLALVCVRVICLLAVRVCPAFASPLSLAHRLFNLPPFSLTHPHPHPPTPSFVYVHPSPSLHCSSLAVLLLLLSTKLTNPCVCYCAR